jgi:hypothetical protein
MPSIPQSLLWISLVVLWLFVLVPMLISKRDAVRRTSDVALATRVLNIGRASRLLRRGRPAAGHRSDPDWQPSADHVDDDLDEESHDESKERAVVRAAVVEAESDSGPDYLDVDVVEDSGALPVGQSANEVVLETEKVTELETQTDELPWDTRGQPKQMSRRAEQPEPDGIEDESTSVADSWAWRRRQTPTCRSPSRSAPRASVGPKPGPPP